MSEGTAPKQVDPQEYREALWWARRAVENDDPVKPWVTRSLLAVLARYENGITWGTSCENCANLLDQLYAGTVEQERTEGDLAVAVHEATGARAALAERDREAEVSAARWHAMADPEVWVDLRADLPPLAADLWRPVQP